MPEIFTLSLKPRYCECDPLNQLHTASYVRYMLHAALEAGAVRDLGEPGISTAEWLERVGDVGVKIIQPALFGDELELQTHLSRSGPEVWRREFTLKQTASGAVAAIGFVDVFHADDVPESDNVEEPEDDDADGADVAEDEPVDSPAWDGDLPDPPEPPGRPFRAVWRSGWVHMDVSGHLDPAWLTQLLGDMEARASEAARWGARRDLEHGISWQAIEHRLEMFLAIQPDEVLNVTSYIGQVGDEDMIRHARIEREDNGVVNEVARARTRWACFSTENGQRCPIPDGWLYDLAGQMDDE